MLLHRIKVGKPLQETLSWSLSVDSGTCADTKVKVDTPMQGAVNWSL